jgi:hypothetical protein
MTMDSAHPPEHIGISAVDEVVDRFLEALDHSTAGLTQCSGTTIAFLDHTGVQWVTLDDRCACNRKTTGSWTSIHAASTSSIVATHAPFSFVGAAASVNISRGKTCHWALLKGKHISR